MVQGLSSAGMTGGPEVHADRVIFRLEDHGYAAVRLQQELERPRSGPPLRRHDGVWELEYRRPQTDRMEYRFEADGESFCDPQNPLRAPGAFGDKSVVEFPGYRPPAWLAAPDPGPAVPVAEHARLWSPPDTDPRRPLPLLVAHDGSEYEQLSQLTRLIAHAIAAEPDPALPRRAARRPRPRRDLLRLGPLRPHAGRHPPPARPRDRPSPALGASLGALALLHTRWLHPGAFGALLLQSGSFFRQRWDRQESGFPRFRRISRFVGTSSTTAAPPRPRSRSR